MSNYPYVAVVSNRRFLKMSVGSRSLNLSLGLQKNSPFQQSSIAIHIVNSQVSDDDILTT